MIKEVDSTISLFSEAEDIHTVSHETWDKFECKSTITLKRIPKVKDLIRDYRLFQIETHGGL